MANKKYYKSKARRANNEGSIYQRSDGLWVGMATVGHDENGKQKRKAVYGKSRFEVANKLTELTNRISNSNYELIENSSFGSLMREWLLVFKKNSVTPRTFEGNLANFDRYIAPAIGNMKLDEVNHITVQKLLNDMLDRNYSLSVVKKVKFLLNQFFNYAVDNNLAMSNPVVKTRVKSSEKKIYDSENKYKAIPQDVRQKFIECLNEHTFLKPFCMSMMFGGLRVGEALALTWNDINFETNTINIEKAATNIPKFDAEGKVIDRQQVVSSTKTACSVREVPMPNILINALKQYKAFREHVSNVQKVDLTAPNMLVFGDNKGKLRSYSGAKCIFARFLKKHNLTTHGIRFHGLRHTYSNTLFEANQNPKVIQGLLGHKSVKTTITTYNSVDKSYFKQAADVFNEEYKDENPIDEKEQLEAEIEKLRAIIKLKELEQEQKEREKKEQEERHQRELREMIEREGQERLAQKREAIRKKKEQDFEM